MDYTWMNRLQRRSEVLSKKEHMVVDYINAHPEVIVRDTQSAIARSVGVSKPVVINTYRKLGFASFHELKRSVDDFFSSQIDSLRATRAVYQRVDSIDRLKAEAREVDARALTRLNETLEPSLLAEIAHRLHGASRVFVCGESTGRYPAHYLWQRLTRYGIATTLVGQDRRHAPDTVVAMEPTDVVVMFHYSDSDELMRRVADYAQARGAYSVLLSGTIHPDYVAAVSRFVHVPRGELGFKNSMAVPMHAANVLLLTYEFTYPEHVDARLEHLEQTRSDWDVGPGE